MHDLHARRIVCIGGKFFFQNLFVAAKHRKQLLIVFQSLHRAFYLFFRRKIAAHRVYRYFYHIVISFKLRLIRNGLLLFRFYQLIAFQASPVS